MTIPQLRAMSPAPTRDDPDNFAPRGDVTMTEMVNQLVPDVNAMVAAVNIVASGIDAAVVAVQSYVTALPWVSGATYAVGDPRYSLLDLLTYRRRTIGAGTTDPKLDSTNWALVSGQTPGQSGNAGKVRTTDSTSESWSALKTVGGVAILGAGDISLDFAPLGSLAFSPTPLSAKWKLTNGASLLQASYPGAFALVGLRPVEAPIMRAASSLGVNISGMWAVGSTCLVQGSSGTLYYGKAGAWNTVTTFTPSGGTWVKVIGTRVYVAPASSGTTVWYSDDECVTWQSFTVPTAYNGTGIVAAGGRYYMPASAPTYLMTSATGISGWVNCTGITDVIASNSDFDRYGSIQTGIAGVGGKWCARPSGTPTNTVWSSSDGIAFVARTLTVSGGSLSSLRILNDAFFISAPSSGTTSYLFRSTDAVTWTNVHPTNGTARAYDIVVSAYIGNKYYLWDQYGVYMSLDGASAASWREVYGKTDATPIARALGVQQLNNAPVWLNTDATSTPVVVNEISNDHVKKTLGVDSAGVFYTGQNSAATFASVKNNVVFYFPTGSSATPYVYSVTAGGGFQRWNVGQQASPTFAGGFHFCITTDRIFFGSATYGTDSLLISDTLYPFNYLTEFALPNLVEPSTGTPGYMKVLP